ncbi:MAG: sigma 54-interacting transcriptional regulator [Intestinimonas sp.]
MTFGNIIGQSREIKQSIRYARKYAEFDNNVLIMGESGVGKDIFAQAIHNASSRRDRPFIAVNCATFPRDLMVSELLRIRAGGVHRLQEKREYRQTGAGQHRHPVFR